MIKADGLCKRYGGLTAIRGVSFEIEYELIYPHPTVEQTHFRRFADRVLDYVLEIKFSPERLPASC